MTEISGSDDAEIMAAVLAVSFDAIITTTSQGVITGWSPAAADLYGYHPQEIIGQNAELLAPAGWQSEEAELLCRAVAGDRSTPYTTTRIRKDGTIITVLAAMSAILDASGAITGMASVARQLPAAKAASSPEARLR